MKINRNLFRRPIALASALALVGAAAAPAVIGSVASAGQASARSIQLSSATPSVTAVSYKVSFTPTVSTSLGGIVVDFCADSPIIGSTTCTVPTSLTIGTPTVAINSGLGTGGTWVTSGSTANTLFYTNSTAQAVTAGTPVVFTISTVTNPSTTGSFFARIVTFNTNSNATTNYTVVGTARAASFTGQVDYGGVALSTANAISITAAVMETLTFCVSKVAPGNGCTGTTTPALTLGHGTPKALDSTATDTDTAYTQISTNATSGAVVNMKNTSSATCAGLSRDAGATCGIAAQTTAGAIAAGTAFFGVQVGAGSGGTGTVSASGSYGTAYYMSNNTLLTYGDPIENTTNTVCANMNSLLTFAASAATTTPAGLYTATESLIATGTF